MEVKKNYISNAYTIPTVVLILLSEIKLCWGGVEEDSGSVFVFLTSHDC